MQCARSIALRSKVTGQRPVRTREHGRGRVVSGIVAWRSAIWRHP